MPLRPLIVALGAALLAAAAAPAARAAAPAAPPPAVVVQPVAVRDVAPVTTEIGRVQAIQSVAIVARVQAYVEKIDFQQGAMVKTGQVLFELQKAPYQAAVDAAQAALQKAQATEHNAQLTYDRDSKLTAGLAVTKAQVDTDHANLDTAKADVLSARANLETAAINFGYTTITSPIAGRIGKAAYTKGNLVGPTSNPLATVVQIDPIWVSFAVADRLVVSALQKSHQSLQQLSSALVLGLQLPNGTEYAEKGKIAFVNNQVDPATGTVTVWGQFPNPQGLLIPNGFATVQIRQQQPEERPLVPVQAVQNDKSGRFVLLVGAGNKVEAQKITIGPQIGQDWIVTSGLKGGERVIIQGQQKVKAGEVVNPVPAAPVQQASASGTQAP